MTDLYVGMVINFAISSVLCVGALWVGRHLSRVVATGMVILLTGWLFLYIEMLHDDLRMARMLPFSNVIVLGNLSAPLVGLIVGVSWRLVPGGKLRKGLVLMPLVGVCLCMAYAPVFATDVPVLGDRWDHGICLQTSKESCSPAAAATLLYAHGIRTTEQEMARLCLTSPRGTTMLGLYRGMKIKTRGTGWDVEIFRGSVQELRGLGGTMLVSVGVKKGEEESAHFEKEYGWPPGLKHTVVVFDFPGNEVEVGDPAAGRQQWSVNNLEKLWYGEGLRLIKAQEQ